MRIQQLKYKNVEIELRQLVQTLPLGAKLPPERELAIEYNCSFLTVRKAFTKLVDDGLIKRAVGSGTFVAKHSDEDSLTIPRDNRIGVLVYQASNIYGYQLLQAVAHAGLQQGIDLRSSWIRDFSDDAIRQANLHKRAGCVALTLPWFPLEKKDEIRKLIQRSPLPISISTVIPGLEANAFYLEQEALGRRAVAPSETIAHYFHALGHKRIGFIGPDSSEDLYLQKQVIAYSCYTSRHGLSNFCGLVAPGAQAMDQLAERWKAFRGELAVVSYDDEHALRFMTAMHKIGLSAPQDYCIIGYNDSDGSRYSDPPLTTIHPNFAHSAHWLLRNALALAKGSADQSTETHRLRMLVRSTCGVRDQVNNAFCARFPEIEIIVDELPSAIELAPEKNAA